MMGKTAFEQGGREYVQWKYLLQRNDIESFGKHFDIMIISEFDK